MGIISFLAPNSDLGQNVFPPASKFDPQRDMPDLSGKVVLVTGGNSGIGFESIKHLLRKNAKVYLACRSLQRGQEANGYDATFGTNVLGHYFLTTLLLPALLSASRNSGTKARIINTSSALASRAPNTPSGIDWDTVQDNPRRLEAMKRIEGIPTYGQSKLANLTLSNIFNNQHQEIASCALHPGVLKSNLGAADRGAILKAVLNLVLWPTEMGPLTQLYAATVPSADEMRGKYYVPWARVGTPYPKAQDRKNQDELQRWLEQQIVGF